MSTSRTVVKERTPGDTSKSKLSLGIPEDHVITWVPFGNSHEDNSLLKCLGKKRDVPVWKIGQIVLGEWLKENRSELEIEAEEFLKMSEKSVEELQKEFDRARRLMEKMELLLKSKSS